MTQIKDVSISVVIFASMAIYLLKPSISNSIYSPFVNSFIVSSLCILISKNKEISLKSYFYTLFTFKNLLYSFFIGAMFALTAYSYAYLKVMNLVEVSRYTAFIPLSLLYVVFHPVLKKVSINKFDYKLGLKQCVAIVSTMALLTTSSVFTNSLNMNNLFLVETMSFVGALIFVCTLGYLSLITSTNSR